jgi:hypothetical protein
MILMCALGKTAVNAYYTYVISYKSRNSSVSSDVCRYRHFQNVVFGLQNMFIYIRLFMSILILYLMLVEQLNLSQFSARFVLGLAGFLNPGRGLP